MAKIARSLKGSKFSARAGIVRETLQKHLGKDFHPAVKSVEVRAKRPLGLLAPRAYITMKDGDGKSLLENGGFSYGTADLTVHKKWLRDKYKTEFDSMYLKPEHRKQGIGSAAFKKMMGAMKELEVSEVNLQADDQGKAVWARMPGVEFQRAEAWKAPMAYRAWRRKNKGPKLPLGAPPKAYPPEFLKQWNPGSVGFIGYKVNVEQA